MYFLIFIDANRIEAKMPEKARIITEIDIPVKEFHYICIKL